MRRLRPGYRNRRNADVSVYGGGPTAEREVMKLLESKRALIQKRIAGTIILKYTPVLRFTPDRNLEEGDRVLNILRSLEEEEGER